MNLFDLVAKLTLDTRPYENSLKKSSTVAKEFGNTLKSSANATETLKNKISVLAGQYKNAQKNVEQLTAEFNKSVKETGATSQKSQELARRLSDAEKEAGSLGSQLRELQKDTEGAGNKFSAFGDKLKKGLGTAAKIGAAAIGAAATAVGAIVKSTVTAYGEYEQLVGGAKKIFDQMDYSVIAQDAQNAWSTMNLSASQYLSMINTVGATFSATMGDEKGYETAKRGMQAIADYASGTGRNVEELNQKFALITRATQSYQSIADQFSGILPATSKDFLAQAKAAGYLSEKYKELTEVPINEYQEAVSKMLEKGVADLGLAGNTAAETASTITGSLAGLRASWQNLLVAFGSGEGIETAMNNLVKNAENVVGNVIPVINTALTGISEFVKGIAPVIAEAVPQIITDVLPSLLESAVGLVSVVGQAILDNLPLLLSIGMDLVLMLAKGVSDNLGTIIPAIVDVILQIVNTLTDPENLDALLDAAFAITEALANGLLEALPRLIEAAPKIIENLVTFLSENLGEIVEFALVLMFALIEGLAKASVELLAAAPMIIMTLIEGIVSAFGDLIAAGGDIVNSIKDGFQKKVEEAKTWGKDLMDKFVSGIREKWENLKQTVRNVAGSIKKVLGFSEPEEGPLSDFHTYAPDMMQLFAKGIRENEHLITDQLNKSFDFGDQIISANAPKLVGAGSGTSITGLTININGANYSDEQALAEAIADRLQRMTERRSAVYA